MKLYATVGLPGGGKSHLARQMVVDSNMTMIRVNRDDLRTMLHVDVFHRKNEAVTVAARDSLVRLGLVAGRDVIVDDTGFGGALDKLRAIADEFGAEFIVIPVDTPVEVCVQRNRDRLASGERGVPERVIWDMYDRFVK